jgi:hypothetical protein
MYFGALLTHWVPSAAGCDGDLLTPLHRRQKNLYSPPSHSYRAHTQLYLYLTFPNTLCHYITLSHGIKILGKFFGMNIWGAENISSMTTAMLYAQHDRTWCALCMTPGPSPFVKETRFFLGMSLYSDEMSGACSTYGVRRGSGKNRTKVASLKS